MKDKVKAFFERNARGFVAMGVFALLFTALYSQGVFDRIYYVRRSQLTETVTYKEDSNIRPIYISWTPSDSEVNQIVPFLRGIDESPRDATKIVLGNHVIGKSVVTVTYGNIGFSPGLYTTLGKQGYLYLYNKDTNTYKGYDVAIFKVMSNKARLSKELKTKYGSVYSVLPWQFKTERSMKLGT